MDFDLIVNDTINKTKLIAQKLNKIIDLDSFTDKLNYDIPYFEKLYKSYKDSLAKGKKDKTLNEIDECYNTCHKIIINHDTNDTGVCNNISNPNVFFYKYCFFSFSMEFNNLLHIELFNIETSINKTDAINKEPENKYPDVFIDGYAYDLFEKLREEINTNEKHNYADFSFIMQNMIKDNYLKQTNHLKLIKFLDKYYKTNIEEKYNQFNTSDSRTKNQVYKRLNNKYKAQIKTVL